MARRRIENREQLASLHVRLVAEGKLSLRQIARRTGVSHTTVQRDVSEAQDAKLLALRLERAKDLGHVYVIEFESGVVKVGRAVCPDSRLASHAGYAQVHGGGIRRTWISDRHEKHTETEAGLIALCKARGTTAFGREYFTGIAFETARDYATLLCEQSEVRRLMDESAAQLERTAAAHEVMVAGSGGDDTMNAVEAYNRGLAIKHAPTRAPTDR